MAVWQSAGWPGDSDIPWVLLASKEQNITNPLPPPKHSIPQRIVSCLPGNLITNYSAINSAAWHY